jgi:hypothetical protein
MTQVCAYMCGISEGRGGPMGIRALCCAVRLLFCPWWGVRCVRTGVAAALLSTVPH